MITSTVAPPSWDAAGGTEASAASPTASSSTQRGCSRKSATEDAGLAVARLAAARLAAQESAANARGGVRTSSPLRKISLTRLEKQVQARAALGQEPSDSIRYLAGVYKIKYVFIYPDSRDIVLAGPAGDWTADREGRIVNRESGRPVLHLDDLVLCLRHAAKDSGGRFGCSINPTQTGLARTQAFLTESAKTKLDPNRRDAWLAKIRKSLGRQEIEVFGVEPRSRAAQVMVEADYRMKLVGLGLEEGVLGVTNYLELLASVSEQTNLDVLRWWFTLDYQAVQTTAARDAFAIRGPSVKVQSENERLTDEGRRVATGEAKGPNERFARTFTEHLAELAQKYPVYADLQNICDLALVAALLRAERVPDQVGWRLTSFGADGDYEIAASDAPKEVESVVAHRVVNRATSRRRREWRREYRSDPLRQEIRRRNRPLRPPVRRSRRQQARCARSRRLVVGLAPHTLRRSQSDLSARRRFRCQRHIDHFRSRPQTDSRPGGGHPPCGRLRNSNADSRCGRRRSGKGRWDGAHSIAGVHRIERPNHAIAIQVEPPVEARIARPPEPVLYEQGKIAPPHAAVPIHVSRHRNEPKHEVAARRPIARRERVARIIDRNRIVPFTVERHASQIAHPINPAAQRNLHRIGPDFPRQSPNGRVRRRIVGKLTHAIIRHIDAGHDQVVRGDDNLFAERNRDLIEPDLRHRPKLLTDPTGGCTTVERSARQASGWPVGIRAISHENFAVVRNAGCGRQRPMVEHVSLLAQARRRQAGNRAERPRQRRSVVSGCPR